MRRDQEEKVAKLFEASGIGVEGLDVASAEEVVFTQEAIEVSGEIINLLNARDGGAGTGRMDASMALARTLGVVTASSDHMKENHGTPDSAILANVLADAMLKTTLPLVGDCAGQMMMVLSLAMVKFLEACNRRYHDEREEEDGDEGPSEGEEGAGSE